MKLLVTGGLGFIGSNFIRLVLGQRPGWRVVNLHLAHLCSPSPYATKPLQALAINVGARVLSES